MARKINIKITKNQALDFKAAILQVANAKSEENMGILEFIVKERLARVDEFIDNKLRVAKSGYINLLLGYDDVAIIIQIDKVFKFKGLACTVVNLISLKMPTEIIKVFDNENNISRGLKGSIE